MIFNRFVPIFHFIFLHSNFSCMARSNIKCDSKFSTADHINFWSPSCLCLWGQGSSKQFYRVWECQRELDNQAGWGTTFRATHRGQGQSYWVWVLENIMDGKVFFRSTLQEAIVIRYFDYKTFPLKLHGILMLSVQVVDKWETDIFNFVASIAWASKWRYSRLLHRIQGKG